MSKRFVRRKWGWYFTLLDRKHFKVKLLRFLKGRSCSNQFHHCRNELWLILSGRGEIQRGNVYGQLRSGHFENIPVMEAHKFTALVPTWVLEIQYGLTCDETDIVRI